MRKPWKEIKQDNGTISIYGNHHWVELDYQIPDWSESLDSEPCFQYKGNTYFLCEFIVTNSPFHPVPEWLKEFSGYMTDSFFSGLLIKFSRDNERVQVYNSIS